MIDRIRRRGRKCLQTTKEEEEEEEEEEEVVTSSVLSAARISISSHQRKIETMLLGEPSTTSSFDNCIPNSESSEDDTSSLVEDELMGLYDTCQKLGSDGSRRRLSASTVGDIIKHHLPTGEEHSYPCKDTYTHVPPSSPEKWPQRPILLRPSPESNMKILGVRYSSSDTYLPLPGTGYCNGCTLPINNGNEECGKCLVIDIESDLFIGTAMLRIKNISTLNDEDTISDLNDNNIDTITKSYFHNKKRTFQGIVRGRFKVPDIPMSECVTGQVFNHPAGHLPPRLIMKGAISIISHLAPQLQARLEGDCPRFLSPLVSTAQSAFVQSTTDENAFADDSIEDTMYEPQPSDPTSLLQELHQSDDESLLSTLPSDSDNITTRIKTRKRAFDKLHSTRCKTPTFDTKSEYTFEFFQHLILFNDFALSFPKPIGKHPLRSMLNGQPLKFMAAHQTHERDEKGNIIDEKMSWLWSFDLWHESLYEDALYHEEDG